jgi:hypothetical protein
MKIILRSWSRDLSSQNLHEHWFYRACINTLHVYTCTTSICTCMHRLHVYFCASIYIGKEEKAINEAKVNIAPNWVTPFMSIHHTCTSNKIAQNWLYMHIHAWCIRWTYIFCAKIDWYKSSAS